MHYIVWSLLLFVLIIIFLFFFQYDVFYKLWAWFLTKFGDIMLSTSPPLVSAKEMRKAMGIVQAGDVLCRRFDCYLDGFFIPGKYTHSGIMIDEKTIVHSIAENVQIIDILDFIKDTDGFIILRPIYSSEQDKQLAIDFAKSKIGVPYDFAFQDGNDAYYCHELTVACLKAGNVIVDRKSNVYLASDIEDKCPRVYESDDPIFQLKKSSFLSRLFPVRYHPKK